MREWEKSSYTRNGFRKFKRNFPTFLVTCLVALVPAFGIFRDISPENCINTSSQLNSGKKTNIHPVCIADIKRIRRASRREREKSESLKHIANINTTKNIAKLCEKARNVNEFWSYSMRGWWNTFHLLCNQLNHIKISQSKTFWLNYSVCFYF